MIKGYKVKIHPNKEQQILMNYWLSVNVKIDENQVNENKTKPIGIDLGLKTLMVCSNGMNFERINTKKKIKKLKRLQRKASRHYTQMKNNKTTEKSSNLLKLEKSILKQNHKISNIRLNNIHQATTKLVKLNPSHIVIEDLAVSNMMKNHKPIEQESPSSNVTVGS